MSGGSLLANRPEAAGGFVCKRRILAWRVADTFAPVNSVGVLLDASRGAASSGATPVVLADLGVENVNAQVDALGIQRPPRCPTRLEICFASHENGVQRSADMRIRLGHAQLVPEATRNTSIAAVASF